MTVTVDGVSEGVHEDLKEVYYDSWVRYLIK